MSDPAASPFANERALKRLRRRRAADRRFKWYGRMAIGFALAALTLLLASIATQAVSAATYHVVSFDLDFDDLNKAHYNPFLTGKIGPKINVK